jgi:small subunit ribosomal protein S3Ae
MNRVIKIPLREITRDFSHTYTNIYMRVYEIVGSKAFTKFIKHEISRDYIGTQVRRHRDALQSVFPAKSADGVEFRIKALVITAGRCSGKQKTTIRNETKKFIQEMAAKQAFGDFILDTLYGKTAAETMEHVRKLAVPLRTVFVYKTQLKELFDTEDVIEHAKAEEDEAPAEAVPSEEEVDSKEDESPAEEAVSTGEVEESEENEKAGE